MKGRSLILLVIFLAASVFVTDVSAQENSAPVPSVPSAVLEMQKAVVGVRTTFFDGNGQKRTVDGYGVLIFPQTVITVFGVVPLPNLIDAKIEILIRGRVVATNPIFWKISTGLIALALTEPLEQPPPLKFISRGETLGDEAFVILPDKVLKYPEESKENIIGSLMTDKNGNTYGIVGKVGDESKGDEKEFLVVPWWSIFEFIDDFIQGPPPPEHPQNKNISVSIV